MAEFINPKDLQEETLQILDAVKRSAERSTSKTDRKVGCIITCTNGRTFEGSTNERTRMIGSTCAERMAIDNLYHDGESIPKCVYVTALLEKEVWTENDIVTPCGVCREMLNQLKDYHSLKDLDIICFSWNKKRILKTTITELLPLFQQLLDS